jgi:hypothetical protein
MAGCREHKISFQFHGQEFVDHLSNHHHLKEETIA